MVRDAKHEQTNPRRGRRGVVFAWILALAVAVGTPAAALPEEGTRDFQVKAVFLYNFAQFVEWPPSAFPAPDTPLVIGVLGLDPFGDFLDQVVRDEQVAGRKLVVQRYRHASEIDHCHILFVSGSEGKRVEPIADALRGRGILTVCDWESFGRWHAVIRFVTVRNQIRLQIDLEAARAAGLTISSKLLRSAESVITARP